MREVGIIGVPMDLGAGRRGVDMGPSAIRYAGLERDLSELGFRVTDYSNLAVPGPEGFDMGNSRAKYESQIEAACGELAERVCSMVVAGQFPLVLGGDHAIAMGTVAGLLDAKEDVGVVWIDAHGDINTPETTPSGNIHGMPVAALLGRAAIVPRLRFGLRHVRPERVVLFGIRSLDPGERALIRELGVRMFTMSELDKVGIVAAVDEAISRLSGPGGIHVSLDMDAVDPLEAPGVGTPWPGGLTYREAHLTMELLAATGQVMSMEVVEVNPIHDHENRTGRLAEELILSALGRTIA
ncbi:MAG TPA: arginase [Chloroflexota bacterium]|jgi:arginase|nr:arginase [Chloroflexota bacterium]